MWSVVCLCLLVSSTIANPYWKQNYEYDYEIRGRTLTSLEVSNQYAGILFKASLKVQPRSDGVLQAQLSHAFYFQVHSHLDNGWGSRLPESKISWKNLPISSKPFQIHMEKGEITGLTVSDDLENWEINVIKGIVSQFQLKTNERPHSDERDNFSTEENILSTFSVMEETVTGETATFYRINTVPEHLIPTYPNAERIWRDKDVGSVFEITKHKNYNMSAELPSFHYGFAGLENGRPSTNKMGTFFTRGSFGRAIVTGDVNRYTIQNSFTVSEISVSPTLMEKQKGSAYSMMNVTLRNVQNQRETFEDISNPLRLHSLVYNHDNIEDYYEEKDARLHMSKYQLSKDRFSRRSSRLVDAEEELNEEGLMMLYKGSYKVSRQDKISAIQKVKELSKEIADDIQDPYTMLSKATMNKFTILSTLVRYLSANELKEIVDELFDDEQDAWKIFKDSVAVAGNKAALVVIKDWIESSRVENAEAAVLVSTMAKTVRQPSVEYLKQFFELAKGEKVMSEWPLNDTIVLSFSQFVRQVYIDEKHSAVQFSGKTLKQIRFPEALEFIKQRVVPFFAEQLHSAIAEAKTHKIHVYIRVLGNIGHPQILVAFKPYLNGEKHVSQYQRLLMTLAIDKLAELYPEHARAVLLRLYQNMGENQPVRAVAVYQIMRTKPSAELLQYMASYTNVDKHDIVNAAVKSVIESAAELRGEEFYEIRQAALTAKPVLTKKTFGIQHGGSYLHHHLVDELRIHFRNSMETVGSEDQFCPRGIKYSLQYNMGGLKNELVNLQTVVSNIDELIHVFKQQTQSYSQKQSKQEQNYHQQAQQKWSSQYIAQLLKYKPEEREQLEGSIYLENGVLQGMVSFDNTSIPNLRKKIRDWETELAEGKQINYVKLNGEGDVRMSFPTEMGFLFVYSYDTPMMVRVQGSVRAVAKPRVSQEKFQKPESVEIATDLTLTMTSKVQGRLSIVTPFNKKQYSAGYDKHAQVHLPMKGNFHWDLKTKQIRADIETENSGIETRLLHYSTWPYTSIIDNKKYEPVALQSDTRIIRQEGLHSYNNVVGRKELGLAVRIQIEHERELVDLHQLRKLVSQEGLTVGLMSIWNEAKIQYSHLNITHVEKDSPTKKLVIRLGKKQEYQAEKSMAFSQKRKVRNDRLPEERLKIAIEKVSAEIKNAKRESYDLSLECQGDREIKYVLTSAYAKSNVDPKSRILVNARRESTVQGEKPYSVSFEAENLIENTEELGHQHSWNKQPKMNSHIRISFGHDSETRSEVQAKVQLQRSEQRERYLREHPSLKQCEIEQGDYAVPACQNISMEVNLLDEVQARITYQNIPQQVKEALKTIYYGARYNYYLNTAVESQRGSERQNEITLEGAFELNLRSLNVSVQTSEEKFILKNIPVGELAKRVIVVHPVYRAHSRLMALAQGSAIYRPSCVVGSDKISTFLQSVYPADISDKWTVMFQFIPKQARPGYKLMDIQNQLEHQTENYVILVKKDSQSDKKEVKIALSAPETEFKVLDITLSPKSEQDGVRVTVNSNDISVKGDETFQYGEGYIQAYSLGEDEVKIEVRDQFYVIFDGRVVKLSLLNGKFKDAIRGICGQFNDKGFEDFRSPSNCFVRDHKKFIESYEVEGTQGKDRREMLSSNDNECVRKIDPVHVKVVTTFDDDEDVSEDCTQFQTKYVEENGEVCFTLRPMPVCSRTCQATSSTERNVPVHCIKKSRVGNLWKTQIDNGGSPDFSHKTETKTVLLQIPQNCA